MKTYYVVPCPCGKTHEVATVQAGSAVPCECGQTLEIPPLRELTALESVQRHESGAPGMPRDEALLGKEGGTRQRRAGSLLLAGILTVLFASLGTYFYVSRPTPDDYTNLPAFQLWQEWQTLSAGVENPLTRGEFLRQQASDIQWRWIYIMACLTVLCAIWMLAVLLAPAAKGGNEKLKM